MSANDLSVGDKYSGMHNGDSDIGIEVSSLTYMNPSTGMGLGPSLNGPRPSHGRNGLELNAKDMDMGDEYLATGDQDMGTRSYCLFNKWVEVWFFTNLLKPSLIGFALLDPFKPIF